MKRSRQIVLVLVASASLTACGPETRSTQRDMYQNRDDCVKDWDEKECEETTDRSGDDAVGAGGRNRFAGASALAPSSRASYATAHTITRGGFGRTGGIFGSGRS